MCGVLYDLNDLLIFLTLIKHNTRSNWGVVWRTLIQSAKIWLELYCTCSNSSQIFADMHMQLWQKLAFFLDSYVTDVVQGCARLGWVGSVLLASFMGLAWFGWVGFYRLYYTIVYSRRHVHVWVFILSRIWLHAEIEKLHRLWKLFICHKMIETLIIKDVIVRLQIKWT